MKKLLLITLCFVALQPLLLAQKHKKTKFTKEESAFIAGLNDLLQAAPQIIWGNIQEGNSATGIDSVFHIVNDSLSFTLSFEEHGSPYKLRFSARFTELYDALTEHHLVLLFGEDAVKVYKQVSPTAGWNHIEDYHLIRAALVKENDAIATLRQEKVLNLFEQMQQKRLKK